MSFLSLLRDMFLDEEVPPTPPPSLKITTNDTPPPPTLEQAIIDAKAKRFLENKEMERKERADREFFEPYVKQINTIVPDLAQIIKVTNDLFYVLQVGIHRFYVSREKIYKNNPLYNFGYNSELPLSKFIEEIGDIVSRNEGYKIDTRFLPCPFCGHDIIRIEGEAFYTACCNKCNARGSSHQTFDEVLAAWNRRLQTYPNETH